jgi:ABC-type transport system substrate-binding protein
MALVAGACGSSASGSGGSAGSVPEGAPVDGGSLVIGVTTETAGWNPHYTSPAESTSFILASMLEPLASTGEDLNAQPFLATSWTPNATFDSWTVKLRDGVVFHNGEKLDATAAKGSIDDGVNGGVSGQAVRGLFKGVTVVDPLTLQIELTQPWAAFPNSFLDSQIAVMMAPASWPPRTTGRTRSAPGRSSSRPGSRARASR